MQPLDLPYRSMERASDWRRRDAISSFLNPQAFILDVIDHVLFLSISMFTPSHDLIFRSFVLSFIRASEHQSIRASEHPSISASEHQRIRASEHPSIRASEHQSNSASASEHQSSRPVGSGPRIKDMGSDTRPADPTRFAVRWRRAHRYPSTTPSTTPSPA